MAKTKPQREGTVLVVGGGIAGVQAAKSAGMLCIAVTNTHPAQNLAEADMVVNSLEGITAEAVASLLPR